MAAALVILVVFAGCGAASTSGGNDSNVEASDSVSSQDPIIIGSTFTLSGPVAHAGQMAFEGAELAIKYVNEELGGINGRPVQLTYYDDEFDETKIPMLYEKLITQDQVDLLLSPYTSPFLAAAPVVSKYDQLMFCIAADSYVANDSFGQNIVNIQMDDQWRGGMWWHDVAEFFAHFDDWNTKGLEKPKTVACVNLEISYGHEIADSVIPYMEASGFEMVYAEFFAPMVADWTPVVAKLKELQPDIVFVPHYLEDCVSFVEKCKEMDYYADYMIIEGMSWDPLSWVNPEIGGLDPNVGKRGFFAYAVYKEAYPSESKDYLAKYTKEKYNSIPGNDLICGFMAVELAAKAANAAGSIEKADLINAMTENTFELAGYPYKMNDTGGNAAEFSWGVGQYIPEDINAADVSGDDWYCIWPQQFKNHDPAYPFPGWN
jgi:branched-chain amino acid transport system substrate-binding protein